MPKPVKIALRAATAKHCIGLLEDCHCFGPRVKQVIMRSAMRARAPSIGMIHEFGIFIESSPLADILIGLKSYVFRNIKNC